MKYGLLNSSIKSPYKRVENFLQQNFILGQEMLHIFLFPFVFIGKDGKMGKCILRQELKNTFLSSIA